MLLFLTHPFIAQLNSLLLIQPPKDKTGRVSSSPCKVERSNQTKLTLGVTAGETGVAAFGANEGRIAAARAEVR